ncbi:MAG: hypothetical protein NTW96_25795 [Planctomycetia bacterium]|nr:hypothetical protein [Planctomycetia bacterium]
MPKSTTSKKSGKAKKPSPDFPLWPHPSGRWCKEVCGRAHYFGKVADDPKGEKALERWNEEKDDLLAGREPRKPGDTRLTVADLCNRFLTAKFHRLASGDLSGRSFRDYKHTCTSIAEAFGGHRAVADLGPSDFETFRTTLGKRVGPVRVANEVNRVRIVFRYALESDVIEKPVPRGLGFAGVCGWVEQSRGAGRASFLSKRVTCRVTGWRGPPCTLGPISGTGKSRGDPPGWSAGGGGAGC